MGQFDGLSREEKEKLVQKLLAERDRRNQVAKLETYNLYKKNLKQLEFHSATKPIRCFFGGNRSGKSYAGTVDCIINCIDREWLEAHAPHLLQYKKLDPPAHVRVVAPDFSKGIEQVMIPAFREWTPRDQLPKQNFDRAYSVSERRLQFINGSTIEFMTNEQDRDKFGGAARHIILYDEEPRLEIRQECMMRLISTGGFELFTLTPLSGMSWLWDQFWEKRDEREDLAIITASIHDNPFLNDATKQRILADPGLSQEARRAREFGEFVAFAGLVYPDFDPAKHIRREFTSLIPEAVDVLVGIDPGVRDPTAVLWIAIMGDGRLHVFHELYLSNRSISEIAEKIHDINAYYKLGESREPAWPIAQMLSPKLLRQYTLKGLCHVTLDVLEETMEWQEARKLQMELRGAFYRPYAYVIDPAARQRSRQTLRTDQAEFANHFVDAVVGSNDISSGVHRIKALFQQDRLTIDPRCVNLLKEIRKYRWRSEPRGMEQSIQQKPVDRDNHALDALRYLCSFIPADNVVRRGMQEVPPPTPGTVAWIVHEKKLREESGLYI